MDDAQAHQKYEEVLFEQLEYLLRERVAHLAKGSCTCSDCARYSRVTAALMEPFEEIPMKQFDHKVKSKKAGG